MDIKTFFAAAASTVGILTLSSPASAVIYDWQFTNEDGNFTTTTPANQDIVAGFVEFNDADVTPNATDVQAINLQITSVTNNPSFPFFGDGGIELNTNLVSLISDSNSEPLNVFNFSGSEEITEFSFALSVFDNSSSRDQEYFGLFNNNISSRQLINENFNTALFFCGRTVCVDGLEDSVNNSSTSTFSKQASASVPFEFSPTLGLILAGSIFAGRGYIKRRQARSLTENNS